MSSSGMVLTVCCIVIAIWDMITVQYGIQFSVSWFIRGTAIDHPTLLICIGMLIGHFFANMKPQRPNV